MRPRTLPAAVAPVLVGSGVAASAKGASLFPALVCLAFALLIQIGTNFANDLFDYLKGADTAARKGPRRAVASGWISPGAMYRGMVVVFGLALLVGMLLVPIGGYGLIVVGIACVLAGLAYTAGPFPLAYNGLGEVFVLIFFGFVATVFTALLQYWHVHGNTLPDGFLLDALIAALAPGSLATGILVVNNLRDRETDRRAGKQTLAVVFGETFARVEYGICLILAFVAPIVLVLRGYSAWVMLPFAIIPYAWVLMREVIWSAEDRPLNPVLSQTGQVLGLHSGLFSLGLAMSG